MSESWSTSITEIEPNKVSVRGYELDQLIGNIHFSDLIFLLFKEKLPTPSESKLFEAILASSIDHGVTPPSTIAARTAISTGAPVNAALAAGILSINKFHGGAIENSMLLFNDAVEKMKQGGMNYDQTALEVVRDYNRQGKRLPGFGHRVHKNDPRTKRLFQIAEEGNLYGQYAKMAEAIYRVYEQETGKNIPINVDGAIAALLCELSFPRELANAMFMIARVPGLIAHIIEEKTTQRPMRKINPDLHIYDGIKNRSL